MGKKDTILLGYKRFTSKKGENYATLELSIPFTEREVTSGCVGVRVESKFVPSHLLDKVDSLTIGKPIGFDYNVVGDRAYISDFYTLDK